ncbi:MAG: pilus assembly protein [Brevundimonas sp.]|jgi:Flp pilus assembly protein TadG|nr:MAG: pilus assembly protein [Brevundimonas sp.]
MTRSLFRRLAGDDRGISAVEFALLAPVVIAFYLGLSEFCQGYMAQKRMGHVASAVADLVAQEESVTKTNLDDIFDIGGLIMKPFSTSTLKQRVSSVTRTGNKVKVDWSRGDGLTALTKGAEITVPTDLLADGQSVIVSEATFDYDSPADYLMPGLTKFSHTYYLRPRVTDKTLCPDC